MSHDRSLPIWEIHPDILRALHPGNRLVLTAPTGSGKTTQVPVMLLQSPAITGQIIILQPRRLAARVVAQRVARELDSPLGQIVGYQTRHESVLSPSTRLRFVTEGLFLRLLQSSPRLEAVSAVILDEFHERNLPADVSLALLKRLQETSRPDLKILVMSATLSTQQVSAYLQAPVLEAHGRLHPVSVHYLPRRPTLPLWDVAAQAAADLLASPASLQGDVLIFMPGLYEIRRTLDACRHKCPSPVTLLPLYGEMPPDQQDAVFAPAPRGQAKIIVATNIAETSITIPNIAHVIDSGLARIHRFDPRRGINVLLLEPVSQASTDQRLGRAGRTMPGSCHRLWPESEQRTRPPHSKPEVLRLDLAEVLLQLLSMRLPDIRTDADLVSFPWLEPPAPLAVTQAQTVLRQLDAVSPAGLLTPLGAAMARLPMHPRLARLMLEAHRRHCLPRAALWAALISERNILLPSAGRRFHDQLADASSDFLLLETAFHAARQAHFDIAACAALGLHAAACREVQRTAALYLDRTRQSLAALPAPAPSASSSPDDELLKCLLVGFPDHLSVYKGPPHRACTMVGERRGTLDAQSILAAAPGLILPVEIIEIGTGAAGNVKTTLSLASRISLAWLDELFPQRLVRQTAAVWNADNRSAEAVDQTSFDQLILEEQYRGGKPDPQVAAAMLADLIIRGELRLKFWDDAVHQWIARARCVAAWFPERKLIAYDSDDQRLILEELCAGSFRWSQVEDKPVLPAFKNALSYEDQRFIEQMTPESLPLPSFNRQGKPNRLNISYQPGLPPTGRAKIQELFGLTQTPTVAQGRIRLRLEILGPNYRPVQLTEDLPNFWQNLYPTLKKELQRKYPRHEWR